MHKFINNQIQSMFSYLIERPDHKYPTNFSQSSFYLKRYSLNSTKYSISIRGPNYEMMLLIKKEKLSNPILSFKKKLNQIQLKLKMKLIIFNETFIILKSTNFIFCLRLEFNRCMMIRQKPSCKSHSLNLKESDVSPFF